MRGSDSRCEQGLSGRRRFLMTSSLALAGLALGCSRNDAAAANASAAPKPVTLVEFSDAGKRLRTVQATTLVRSEAEWRKRLSPLAFDVTRKHATERPYTGALLKVKAKGVYRCICCDTALFDSATKYDSGTGWPSFWRPIAAGNVVETGDRSLGMLRTEVSCARCAAHLGHVFDDGPKPTGLRYCMNSVSLRFAAAA